MTNFRPFSMWDTGAILVNQVSFCHPQCVWLLEIFGVCMCTMLNKQDYS